MKRKAWDLCNIIFFLISAFGRKPSTAKIVVVVVVVVIIIIIIIIKEEEEVNENFEMKD